MSSTTQILGNDEGPLRLQLKVNGPNVNAVYDLPDDSSMLIGRGPDVDIDLPASSVSRRHARLHLQAERDPVIEDMGSANKTRVAGAILRPGERLPLRPGQAIRIWEYVLILRAPMVGSDARGVRPSSCNSTVQMMQSAEPGLVLHDEKMKALYRQARQAAAGNVTVLIQGETGSGKDVLARAIHRFSPRAARPFGTIDLGASPENLIESELFGHEKGAFTTADRRKVASCSRRLRVRSSSFGNAGPHLGRDILEASISEIFVDQPRILERLIEVIVINLRVNVSIHLKNVLPTVIVIVNEPAAPCDIAIVDSDACSECNIVESSIAIVVVQVAGVISEVGFEDVEPSIAVVVGDSNAHSCLFMAAIAISATSHDCNIGERAIMVVLEENARLRIYRDINIRPSIIIEVVGDRSDGVPRARF